ncbi:hypothetical protein [Actinomadura litoris]|uniref:Uncharacterized protein n=1 Tax=Actinomadura litoris TaxID=2678616 RepID=A0A7K1KYT6_9ACTN|nr:hypothetical protein [Actinomadura litoris]MUN37217.1 hypothetical protein [Actinomadura litoris]
MTTHLAHAAPASADRPTRPPRRGRRARRVAAMGVGGVLLLAGSASLAAAGLQARSGGYFGTPEYHFATDTAALKTDEIDVGSDGARPADPDPDVGELARVRIVVRPQDPGVPLFVGIGPKTEVEKYLRNVAHDEFASARLDPFKADFRRSPGAATAPDPAAQPFWVATSTGRGTRTLNWNKTHGAWSVVLLRRDGRPGVEADASIGLRFGFLLPAGLGLLVAGTATIGHLIITRGRPRAGRP